MGLDQVLTLIAGPERGALGEPVLAAARATLEELGAEAGPPHWLAPRMACDIPFSGADAATLEKSLRRRLLGLPIDLAVQPQDGRRRRLLLADMESTIVTRELTDELAALVGLGERVRPITARAMRGEIDFAASLRERVSLLAGQPAEILERVKKLIELTPGARSLVQTMKAHGAYAALLSGGFDCFAAPVAAACGFDEFHANRLLIEQGTLSGKVAEPVLDRQSKLKVLERLACERGIPLGATAAVGDGANDIPMIERAGLGVAYHAKPVVAATARFRLDHADLTGLLYFQGYRSEEFHG
jgi:phosphoserine phosphatase